jgi:predicted nuclease of predicted toxin-antitoxin system
MKFLVDEQLPPLLADWIISKGFDAAHVFSLGTDTSIFDSDICAISMAEKRIVITKDEDFFNSYIFQKQPYKLIFVTTGNCKNRALLDLFRVQFQHLCQLLEHHNLIEINQTNVKIWF